MVCLIAEHINSLPIINPPQPSTAQNQNRMILPTNHSQFHPLLTVINHEQFFWIFPGELHDKPTYHCAVWARRKFWNFFSSSSISRRGRDGRTHFDLHAASGENMHQELHNCLHAYDKAGAHLDMGPKLIACRCFLFFFVQRNSLIQLHFCQSPDIVRLLIEHSRLIIVLLFFYFLQSTSGFGSLPWPYRYFLLPCLLPRSRFSAIWSQFYSSRLLRSSHCEFFQKLTILVFPVLILSYKGLVIMVFQQHLKVESCFY